MPGRSVAGEGGEIRWRGREVEKRGEKTYLLSMKVILGPYVVRGISSRIIQDFSKIVFKKIS